MTTTEPGPTWAERLNPRNWPLVWKLIAIGLVPALLALTLGVLRISDQAGDAADLGASNRLLEARGQVADTAVALRQERDEAALFVAAGRTEDRSVLDLGIGQTDATAREAFEALAGAEDLDSTTSAARDQAQQALDSLVALRTDVGAGGDTTTPNAVITNYTGVLARIDGLDRALLRQLRAPGVAGMADALSAVTGASEQLAIQHTVLGAAIRAGQLRPTDVAASVAADNRLVNEYSTYAVALTPEQLAAFGSFDGVESNAERNRVEQLIITTPLDQPVVIDPTLWDAAYATALEAVLGSGERISTELSAVSTRAEEVASSQAGINSVILMLGLLIGIAIAVLVARALVRSLRVLRTAALDVADRRLPQAVESMRAGRAPDITVDPVPLTGRDEVGQVARAFDAVHGQAIRLAADQAALQANVSSMFVNLSRRSQALVERQLQLIESLESSEQDADQLANLFQLDHLATRMRRNSENLLVLAGTELTKRNMAPVPMVDVLRAAVSEVEQYQRVVVQSPPTITIAGRAASDIVHLLAELLDNATNFSPPESQVVMSTTRTGNGSVLVEIADRGVGMVDHELADANTRLAGPMAVDVSASRRMGLFVIGRLAARHEIEVQLSTAASGGPGSGLTASVTIPAGLVPAQPGAQPRADRTAAGSDAARAPIAYATANGRTPAGGTATGLVPAGLAGAGPSTYGAPGSNGHGPKPGSLSAFVAGNDGPTSSNFGIGANVDSPSSPALPKRPTNGSSRGQLPTRRPGSALGPDGNPRTDTGRNGTERPVPFADAPPRDDADSATRANPVVPHADDDGTSSGRPRPETQSDPDTGPTPLQRPGTSHGVTDSGSRRGLGNGRDVDSATTRFEPRRPEQGRGPRPGGPISALPSRIPFPTDSPTSRTGETPAGGGNTATPTPGIAAIAPGTTARDTRFDSPASTGPQSLVPQQTDGEQTPATGIRADEPISPQSSTQQRPAQPGQDELFTAGVPATGGPGNTPVGGAGTRAGRPQGSSFELGETTPIFEEIASAWFRSNREVPVEVSDDAPAAAPQGAPTQAPSPRPRPTPVARPAAAPPARTGQGAANFASAADEGWRLAAGQAAAADERADETTSAGLPKRRPRARLVPGSAGSAVLTPPVSPARNAESVRGRLASYQQGVRQGRETRLRGDSGRKDASPATGTTESANAGGHQDEERP